MDEGEIRKIFVSFEEVSRIIEKRFLGLSKFQIPSGCMREFRFLR